MGGTFSVKGQLVNILGFVGHGVSVTTTPLCRVARSSPRQSVSDCEWLCPSNTLFMDTDIRTSYNGQVSPFFLNH